MPLVVNVEEDSERSPARGDSEMLAVDAFGMFFKGPMPPAGLHLCISGPASAPARLLQHIANRRTVRVATRLAGASPWIAA